MPRFSTLIRSSTLRAAGAVAAVAVTAPLHGAQAQDIQQISCKAAKTLSGPGVWQAFAAPTFSDALGLGKQSQTIVSYAVGPNDPRRVAVTNGNSVYFSTNSGCNWSLGFRLDQTPADAQKVPLSGTISTIKSVFISPSGTFFATVQEAETELTVGRPHVVRSTSGRIGSWTLADSGLPPLGKPLLMRGMDQKIYLSFSGAQELSECPPAPLPCESGQNGERLGLLYGSTNDGETWASRTEPSDLNDVAAIKYFSIDDDAPRGDVIWVVANGQLRKSDNGGRTFTEPDGLDQADFRFTAVHATTKPVGGSDKLKILAFDDDGEMIRLEGSAWIRSRVSFGAVESVAQRPEGDIAVSTVPFNLGGISIYRIFPKDFHDYSAGIGVGGRELKYSYGWEPISPANQINVNGRISSASGDAATAGTYYVRDARRVLRFLKSRLRATNTDAAPIVLGAPPPPTGRILPANLPLPIDVGKSKTVNYTLTLPPAPTPIDVFLLIDNSGSMLNVIDDLKRNLRVVARSLHDSGVDVNMGVGQINVQPEQGALPIDDPKTDVDESKPRPLYERLRAIGGIDASLFNALQKLNGASGSGDEAQLESLWQAAVGDGNSLLNLGFLAGYRVAPGLDAGFRDALSPIKIIVHATDEEFSTNIEGGHTFEQVVAELNNRGIKQIGLSQDVDEAEVDLERMARATGALAPPGGTDCDGDGRVGAEDVKAGQPLVCGQSFGLDTTLTNLIRSLSDIRTISLRTSKNPSVKKVTATSWRIDAKQPTKRTFSITYSCKGIAAGAYVNDIGASLGGRSIANAVTTVYCGGVTAPAPPQVPVDPPNIPPPPQIQPLAPAPVPVNPVLQPQTQPQPQTQVNAQTGMASQEQDQLQLAVADNDIGRQDEEQLAMSRLTYETSPGLVLASGMAMATALATGVALRRRTRTAVARATLR